MKPPVKDAPLRPLRKTERERLLKIAELCEAEAEQWAEGFAVWRGDRWDWSGECNRREPHAHLRFIRHHAAAEFLRHLAARQP